MKYTETKQKAAAQTFQQNLLQIPLELLLRKKLNHYPRLQLYFYRQQMPRFVAKEDVEKGLVDPKKPLKQQPEYQKKLQQESKKKQPTQKLQKKQIVEGKQKKQRRENQDRPRFNWDKRQITLETPVPEAPKKVLPKPDSQNFNATLKKLREQIDSLIQQKRKLIIQQKNLLKDNSDNKKSGFNAISKYGSELKQKNNLKNIFSTKIKKLQEQRNHIQNQIKQLKQGNGTLRTSKKLEHMSAEQLKQKIYHLEHQMSTANLDKKAQAQINNSVNEAKRALLKARAEVEIQTELSKNDDKIKILTEDSRGLKKEIDAAYAEFKPLKKEIGELMQKRKQQQGTVTQVTSIEEVKAGYDQKIKALNQKKEQAYKKQEQLKIKYYKDLDTWQDQQDLLRYIKYIQDEQDYKRKIKQENQKRQKQWEQKDKQKKKQFEQRQKRKEQRQKQQQERKKRQQQRKQKLHKQRETFINRNPNWQRIQSCQFMIKYCQNLKPEDVQKDKNGDKSNLKTEQVNLEAQKGWEKESKSGCQMIVGKKNKTDEQAPKKAKKEKKVKSAEDDGSINHNIDSINRFHDLNVLPPKNISELEQTIKQIREKIDILNKCSEQDIAAFKTKAEKQFDRIHGFHEQKNHDHELQEKQVKHQKKKERTEKVELKGSDFPELN